MNTNVIITQTQQSIMLRTRWRIEAGTNNVKKTLLKGFTTSRFAIEIGQLTDSTTSTTGYGVKGNGIPFGDSIFIKLIANL